ncbi:cupin domain-containing protein [Nocardia sp. NEAU-G5]|uniref:Cupin domain-containing protein n=1 Tax=Nocardia albiluteola TaxID=2842303 RepID=A0ABS6B1M2_9NOCA|nr:cupin domain-containing protein [Nocardia albiluteola]MBU3063175.1 cupin domain-containing protein [Nocardia albiluteola]
MEVRRVVAGTDNHGKSVFLSDGPAPHSHEFERLPGQAQARVWFTPGPPVAGTTPGEPTSETGPVIPGPGGASFVIVRYTPDSVVESAEFDAERANEEFVKYAPDIAAASDPDEPGMHRTASVDYGVVLDGEIWLELDDGAQTRLAPGDTIVQLAGRHAWRNKTDRPATVAFVLTGLR